jgi:hypothetical protein
MVKAELEPKSGTSGDLLNEIRILIEDAQSCRNSSDEDGSGFPPLNSTSDGGHVEEVTYNPVTCKSKKSVGSVFFEGQ